MKKLIRRFSLEITLVLGLFLALGGSMAGLVYGQGNPNRNPVAICHGTASHTNQYTQITVDQDSVDGDLGNDNGQGDHYSEHTGSVWYEGIEGAWGDIIPPIEGVHSGLNWTAEGQAFWNNNCNSPSASADPSGDPESSPAPESKLTIDGMHCDSTTFDAWIELSQGGVPAVGVTVTFTYRGTSKDAVTGVDGKAKVTFGFLDKDTVTADPADPFETVSGEVKAADQCESRGGSSDSNSGGQVLGASTSSGQVLGASTLADTGAAQQTIVSVLFTLAAAMIWVGVKLHGVEENSKVQELKNSK